MDPTTANVRWGISRIERAKNRTSDEHYLAFDIDRREEQNHSKRTRRRALTTTTEHVGWERVGWERVGYEGMRVLMRHIECTCKSAMSVESKADSLKQVNLKVGAARAHGKKSESGGSCR